MAHINNSFRKLCYKGVKKNSRVVQRRGKILRQHLCVLTGITDRKRKLTMQERDNCRSQCKAGGLVLDRNRDGSLLVRGERPYDHLCTWVSRFAGGAGGEAGGRRWKFSSDCFYYRSEIRNIVIIIRVRMRRGY